MVGSFGEVQVMDWGLAKVLAAGGVADEPRRRVDEDDRATIVATVRSGPAGSGAESQAGSVLGTPAYMAPKQARGEVDRLDERSDVFGLGALLGEILTGKPPYAGGPRRQLLEKAARADLADAFARLDPTTPSTADQELPVPSPTSHPQSAIRYPLSPELSTLARAGRAGRLPLS
jgi:serine/threonine-protein kinase